MSETRKVAIDLTEISKEEYDEKLKDTAHHFAAPRDSGFLHHDGKSYTLYLTRDKRYFTATRGFSHNDWARMQLENVEYDPIAVYVIPFREAKQPWKPGEDKPDEGTPEEQIARMKSPAKKQARKRA